MRSLRWVCQRAGDSGHLGHPFLELWHLSCGGAGPKAVSRPSCGWECGLDPKVWSQQASLSKHVVWGFPLACCLTKGESSSYPHPALSTFLHLDSFMNNKLQVPGCRQASAIQGSSSRLFPPSPAQDAWGKHFSLLMGPRANNQQIVRNALLCQEKCPWSKSPSVLFLEVNVMVLCFRMGFACCYIPLQSLLKQEEPQGGSLLEFAGKADSVAHRFPRLCPLWRSVQTSRSHGECTWACSPNPLWLSCGVLAFRARWGSGMCGSDLAASWRMFVGWGAEPPYGVPMG